MQYHAVRLQVFHEIYGDSRASVGAFERFVADAEELETVIRKRFDVGTVRQQDLTLTASYAARAKKELEALKLRVGAK
ncbi:hypothetical protein [Limnoglobus roseus]|uniref:hypothetical protein n=1 Tax=Limnoglobus roseus TaxID=2598579 RepID=UPI0011EB4DA5|nr:hypothetical protein [Limnoglobus roseus]